MAKNIRKTETRFDEVIITTSDPQKMLGKYINKTVKKTYTDDFLNEDTGEIVQIEREQVLFEKGKYIDQDVLARIRFSMAADGISEIEVSNQNRLGYELENYYLHPWLITLNIDDKKHKLLLYAGGIGSALTIVKDYAELNYSGGFSIIATKELDDFVILTDNLKKVDMAVAYLKDEIDTATAIEAVGGPEIEPVLQDKRFFQIDTTVVYGKDDFEQQISFIVHSCNIERAMMIIQNHLAQHEEKKAVIEESAGRTYDKRDFKVSIEKATQFHVGRFIPQEFSQAYCKKND